MIRASVAIVLALVLAGIVGGLAPASGACVSVDPAPGWTTTSSSPDGDDCCPDGCTDCHRPCCQAPVLAYLAPAPVLVATPSAIPAPRRIESQRGPAPLSALDRPPRS